MSYIGYSAVGFQRVLGDRWTTHATIKAMCIDPVGIHPHMYVAAATWPTWPTTATFTPYDILTPDLYMSIFFTEGENDEAGISSITAHIRHSYYASAYPINVVYQAGLYDTDAKLLGTTATVTRGLSESPEWVQFTFATPLSRDAGESLYIALWAEPSPNYFTYFYAHPSEYADQDYWQPIPPGPPAPDGGSGPAGPLFTGGGML